MTEISGSQGASTMAYVPAAPAVEAGEIAPDPSKSRLTVDAVERDGSDESRRLQLVIEQRERQLMTAMTENAALTDAVNGLRSRLEDLEKERAEERTALETLLKQASEKLVTSEAKLVAVGKGSLQSSAVELTKQLQEKDEKVRLLLEEGEIMSKTELKLNTNLKKLRAKEAETEKDMKELSRKLEVSASEITELKERIGRLNDVERRLTDTIKTLNGLNEQQAKQAVKLENEAAGYREEINQLKSTIERTRADLQDARRMQAEALSAVNSEALEHELKKNEELHRQLEESQRLSNNLETALRRESLHARLQDADARHEDLSAEARTADRPLVRQIESLQNQHAIERRDWEQIENSLTQRLRAAENERNASVENERSLLEKFNALNNRLSILELQAARERQDNARLAAELESERLQGESHERLATDLTAKLELLKSSHARAMEEAKENFQRMLRKQIQEERDQWEERAREERTWSAGAAAGGRDMGERHRPGSGSASFAALRRLSASSSTSASAGLASARIPSAATAASATADGSTHSGPSTPTLSAAPEVGHARGITAPLPPLISDASISSTVLLSGTPAVVIDRLHTAVKQLQGQVGALQAQLSLVTQTRDELADELLKSTTETSNMRNLAARAEASERQLAELNTRYLACLELLGERTEQLQDLRSNAAEARAAYQRQVDDLLARLQ
ncbi:hypothetical protein HK405_007272, partial [Cladochytrium tenue]